MGRVHRRALGGRAGFGSLLCSVRMAMPWGAATGVLLICGAPAAASTGSGAAGSLPTVSSGARPGPSLLYAPPATSPVLQNTGVWKAPPTLVSGSEAYRDGEFLYQDFLYDDDGGGGAPDPSDPFTGVANLFSPKTGTLTYPTDTKRYANNAADLLEFRVKPLSGATAFRVTMNTMIDPSTVGFTVAIGGSAAERSWPFDAGVTSPAKLFLTVHGTTGVLTSAATGASITPAPTVQVSIPRHQFEVLVPHAAWNPGRTTVRMEMGTGLWNAGANTYNVPGAVASATTPGGASADNEAIFNLAFRSREKVPSIYVPGIANTIAEGGALVKEDGSWWRERDQADALASGDVSQFSPRSTSASCGGG